MAQLKKIKSLDDIPNFTGAMRQCVSTKSKAQEDADHWMKYRGTPEETVFMLEDISNTVRLVVRV